MAFRRNTVWQGTFRQHGGGTYQMVLFVREIAGDVFDATLVFPTLPPGPDGKRSLARVDGGATDRSRRRMQFDAIGVSGRSFARARYEATRTGTQLDGICIVGGNRVGSFRLNT